MWFQKFYGKSDRVPTKNGENSFLEPVENNSNNCSNHNSNYHINFQQFLNNFSIYHSFISHHHHAQIINKYLYVIYKYKVTNTYINTKLYYISFKYT